VEEQTFHVVAAIRGLGPGQGCEIVAVAVRVQRPSPYVDRHLPTLQSLPDFVGTLDERPGFHQGRHDGTERRRMH
jgi:hypothetical protein